MYANAAIAAQDCLARVQITLGYKETSLGHNSLPKISSPLLKIILGHNYTLL